MLNEIKQKEKAKSCMISLICEIKKKKILIEIEIRMVISYHGQRSWVNRELWSKGKHLQI